MSDYNEPYLTLNLTGLNYDTPAYDLPLDQWSEGKNIRFADGAAEKFKGHQQVFGTLNHAANWTIPVGYGASYYWVYANNTAVSVTDMAVHSTITPAAGVNAVIGTNWNGGLINNYVVMNNGQEAPIWWDGVPANIMTALPAWPANTLAAVIRPYKQYLVALDITDASGEFPDMVLWSDAAPSGSVPASWDVADATKDAGQTELSDTPGENVDGLQLGDAFIIYKRNASYIMQFVGGQFIHQFRKCPGRVGILTSDCVGQVYDKHLVLTQDDLVLFDGVSKPTSILDSRMRSWLFNSISSTNYQHSFIVARHEEREMWVCVPTTGSTYADTALVWNYEDNTLGLRDLPDPRYAEAGVVDPGGATNWDADSQAWDDDTTTWDQRTYSPSAFSLIICDQTNSKLFEADQTDAFDGATFNSYVLRESMPLLDRHNLKLIKGLYPKMSSSGNPTVQFRVGTQLNATDLVTWGAEQDFVVGVDDKIDVLTKGRYISIRCGSTADVNWKLHGFDLELETAERR